MQDASTPPGTAYPQCRFQVGDLVMFSRRCQTSPAGMKVEEVDINMFDALLRVDGKWWHPECFMSLAEWQHQTRH